VIIARENTWKINRDVTVKHEGTRKEGSWEAGKIGSQERAWRKKDNGHHPN